MLRSRPASATSKSPAGEAWRTHFEEAAKAAKREGQKRGGETAGRGRPKQLGANFVPSYDPMANKAATQIAATVGLSRPTYVKVASIVEAAREAACGPIRVP